MSKAYLALSLGSTPLGTISLTLDTKNCPKTVRNFTSLLQREEPHGYLNTKFHRIIKNFMAQGGDYENSNGTGGKSIYGPVFEDENFINCHSGRGTLSMANCGPDTNGSQFFIAFREVSHLDGKHVVFGWVEEEDGESWRVLEALEKVNTDRKDVPMIPVIVSDCGLVVVEEETKKKKNQMSKQDVLKRYQGAPADDDDEIDLDDDDDDEEAGDGESHDSESDLKEPQIATESNDDNADQPATEPPLSNDNETPPPPKMTPLQMRMHNLKMKMNQSRQLNRKEVLTEGERLGSEDGIKRERIRLKKEEKKMRDKEWGECHNKATNNNNGGKFMAEQATDSMKRAGKKAVKAKANRFATNDYYNPEGQHRHYERDLKSVSSTTTESTSTSTYDPLSAQLSSTDNNNNNRTAAQGARRLAQELQRRGEKSKATRRDRAEFEATDVSSINRRNKAFNEKISRNYDKYTTEIRQNLERGTAS